jgi:hypothetical protein
MSIPKMIRSAPIVSQILDCNNGGKVINPNKYPRKIIEDIPEKIIERFNSIFLAFICFFNLRDSKYDLMKKKI